MLYDRGCAYHRTAVGSSLANAYDAGICIYTDNKAAALSRFSERIIERLACRISERNSFNFCYFQRFYLLTVSGEPFQRHGYKLRDKYHQEQQPELDRKERQQYFFSKQYKKLIDKLHEIFSGRKW